MRKTFLVLAAMLSTVCAMAQTWDAPDPSSADYSHEKTVIWTQLVVNGQSVMPSEDGYSVGAFIDGECRAVSPSSSDFSNNQNVFALQVRGKSDEDETGATIELKVKEQETGIIYTVTLDQVLTYQGEATIGQPSSPVVINLTPITSYLRQLRIENPIFIDRSSGQDVSINLLDYITINQAGDKMSSLSTIPEFTWRSQNESAVVVEGNVATAKGSTNVYGCSLEGIVSGVSLYTTVHVTPYLREVCGVEFNTNPIDIERGTQASLLDYVDVLYSTGIDESGELTTTKVAAKDVTEPLHFLFYQMEEDAVAYFTLEIETGDVNAINSTLESGCGVMVNIAQTNFSAQTVVRVTPFYVPMEGFEINENCERGVRMSRLEPYTLTITPVPANATIEDGYFISLYSDNSDLATCEQLNDQGTEWKITATGVGNLNVWVGYRRLGLQVPVEIGADYPIADGWSWVSLYSLPEENDLTPADLSSSDFYGDGLLEIRSQEALTYNDPEWGWFGPLDNISDKFYKLYNNKSTDADAFVYYGGKLTSENEHREVLQTGWNWLHYPYFFNLQVEALSEMFTPSEGDIVLSKDNGFALYYGNQWNKSDENFFLHYGEGYMYVANEAKTINWRNSIDRQLNPYKVTESNARGARTRGGDWSYDASQFSDNMPIIAAISGQEHLDSYLTVGAFVNGECRGEGKVVSVDGQDYLFITVHGQAGDQISFELNDGTQVSTQLAFGRMAGSISQPVMLSSSQTTGIASMSAQQNATIYDVNGKLVGSSLETLPAGVYMISEGGITRKIVK